jgi:hypothetical protein
MDIAPHFGNVGHVLHHHAAIGEIIAPLAEDCRGIVCGDVADDLTIIRRCEREFVRRNVVERHLETKIADFIGHEERVAAATDFEVPVQTIFAGDLDDCRLVILPSPIPVGRIAEVRDDLRECRAACPSFVRARDLA